jgi:hypothetical protein
MRALPVFALIAAAATAMFVSREPQPPPLCHPETSCVAALGGGETLVSTSASGRPDATLEPAADGSVSLVGLDGQLRWRVASSSTAAPELVAAGDVGTDGVTDYVLGITQALAPAQTCGSGTIAETALLVVDGRTGEAASPFGSLPDICWGNLNYPTRQWGAGTAYIGELTDEYRGPEVVVLPYYATHGEVWNLGEDDSWRPVGERFPYPSTPEFDRVYREHNDAPCAAPAPGGPCYIENSHVANAVFPPEGDGALFVLTSARAVVYRPDLTPTSDLAWWPGDNPENGGRNYGLVETYQAGDRTYADLVGGCSTISRWRAMTGAEETGGDANCGVTRHFERFELDGTRIAKHDTVYYGYLGLEGRVEFPARPRAALGGRGTSWTAFNVVRGGTWSAQVFTGPMRTEPMELPGWYVWDTVELADGGAGLLASRVTPGSLVPSWELDVLRWNGSSTFASVWHADGVVPALLPYASTPTRHTSEDSLYGAYAGSGDLLVVDATGKRRFVSLAAGG